MNASIRQGLERLQDTPGYQSQSSKASPQQLHQKLLKQLRYRQMLWQPVMPAMPYWQVQPGYQPKLLPRQRCIK